MLPKSFVLVTRDRRYLDAAGCLTPDRAKAVRLTMRAAGALLFRRPFGNQLWGLSMEECSKAERRRGAPISSEEAVVLMNDMQARTHRAQAAQLLQQAAQAEAMAQHYRKQAKQLAQDMSAYLTRRITLNDE